jgi:hypothetical protein
MKTYICESETYDPNGGEYNSVEEFLAMCNHCFGEEPGLREDICTGDYFDCSDGHLVLSVHLDPEETVVDSRELDEEETKQHWCQLCANHADVMVRFESNPSWWGYCNDHRPESL